MSLDSKIPAGEMDKKWTDYKGHVKLVNPANKRKLEIIVVGTGLAGASAAASLGEMGYRVKAFCFQDSPRRAHSIAAQGGISASMVDDLRDAFEFISMVRLQHQAKQIEKGLKPNNYVPPEELSALERRHLKDAFEVISTMQEMMSSRYHADRFR